MTATLQMAFAGVWDRFPKLQFYSAETMVGWLEYGSWRSTITIGATSA